MRTDRLLEKATKLLKEQFHAAGEDLDAQIDASKPALYDIVLEGGGLRGIAHLGVLFALETLGLRFRHVGGTSAGALSAAMLAVNTKSITEKRVPEAVSVTFDLDYMAFVDGGDEVRTLLESDSEQGFGGAKVIAALKNITGLIRNTSVNPSDAFIPELNRCFEKHVGERYQADLHKLRTCREEQAGEVARNFGIDERFAVPEFQAVVVNLYSARKEVLPRDLSQYGVEHFEGVSLLSLVKASAAIPFFFAPVPLCEIIDSTYEEVLFADGGVVDNFPVDLFETDKSKEDPVESLYIELTEKSVCEKPIENTLDIAIAIYRSVFHQKKVLSEHQQKNHISVDLTTEDCSAVDMLSFNLSENQQQALFMAGVRAGAEWLLKHQV